MEITQDLNKIAAHPLQSSYWADFRKAWGNEIVITKYGLITLSKIPLINLKIGIFEKGPKPDARMVADLTEIAKKNNCIFIKLEPNIQKTEQTKLPNVLVPGRRLFTPTTFWIDLTKSEEELLKSFSSKTRYNIRLAQRNGVTVTEDNSDKAFERYLELTKETSQRQGFYAHSEKYHRLMWKYLKPAGITHLLTATYKEEIITAWILFEWKDFLYYPYGASTEKYKNVMANNLMMWEAIRLGKKLGLRSFDLWGREEGKGFTKFKEGYNPKVIEFLGTWDLPTSIFYWPYRVAEAFRWRLLRLITKIIKPKF